MKTLQIELSKKDLKSVKNVLTEVAENIEQGFTSGIEFPVNWKLEETPKVWVLFETDLHKSKASRIFLGVFSSFEIANEYAKKNDCYRNNCEVVILQCDLNKFEEQ